MDINLNVNSSKNFMEVFERLSVEWNDSYT